MPRPSATFERVESTQNQRRSRYQHAPLVWLSRTFGGAQSRRDEAQRLGSAAPLSIFRAAPIAKWQQAAGLPKNAFTSNGITALGLLPFHQKCGRAEVTCLVRRWCKIAAVGLGGTTVGRIGPLPRLSDDRCPTRPT